jgi:hypothetical protein
MSEHKVSKLVAILAAGIFVTALMLPSRAGAIEVKKMIGGGDSAPSGEGGGGGPAAPNPMSKAQQQALQDAVANDSDAFVGQESEKKSSGDAYVDFSEREERDG